MILLALACTQEISGQRLEPSFVYVSVLDEDIGTEEAPLPFSSELRTSRFSVELLDADADPWDFQGDLSLRVRPGILEQARWIQVSGTEWEGEVSYRNGFGPTRIWFADEGDKDASSPREPSFATGVSAPIWFQFPTIGEMNRTDDHATNQLAHEFAELRAADRDIRVSAVGTNGYWVTDLADGPGEFNSLFVYTFSRPDDAVEVGRRITLLTGNNQEYLQTTQISFPTYVVGDDPIVAMPEPALLNGIDCEDHDTLEGYENTIVRLEDVDVPASFGPNNEEYEDFLQYGQWPVGDCGYKVASAVTVPDYVPQANDHIAYAQGMLIEVFGMWIITPRDAEDLSVSAGGPPMPQAQPPSPPLPPGYTHADLQDDPCLP